MSLLEVDKVTLRYKTAQSLVTATHRVSFQVHEKDLTGPQVVQRRLLAVLPIFMTGKIAEQQTDEKGIFPPE